MADDNGTNFDARWPRVLGEPENTAIFRREVEDFQVEEELGFEPSGEGEHVFLWIEKNNSNTAWVADQLASFAKVARRDVAYSGLKDRRAATWQWFSVTIPGKSMPDWSAIDSEGFRVISAQRHAKKLRRGVHRRNRFRICLRDVSGDRSVLEKRCESVRDYGCPNYFGEQRFGRGANNLNQARAMFAGRRVKNRDKRSMYLSAVRSWLFNEVLAERVRAGNWNRCLDGDIYALAGSSSLFHSDASKDLGPRMDAMDIHATGPMWGRGGMRSEGACAELEATVCAANSALCEGLEAAGLSADRRALRQIPQEFEWHWSGEDIILDFWLDRGCFATAVLRELVTIKTIASE